jgi:hypothetical protein
MWHVARGLAVVLCLASFATGDPRTFQGRRLDEALRLLQQDGLPIVFSSEIVTPSMRVAAEPRATIPRQQLDELLAPHGLKAEAGPGRVILVVRDHSSAVRTAQDTRPAVRRRDPAPPASNSVQGTTAYTDSVSVWGSREQMDRGASETSLDSRALRLAGSPLQSDALEAIHAMPRVAAVDDYRGDFSVRGSPYRQIGIVVDGVATRWLQHTVYGRNDAGSLSMFGSDILDRATLQAGAYPRRYDDALGAQLELTLKEGSRDSTRFTAMAGGMSAAVVGEGPIGSDGRGSWVAGVRNSYRSWPPRRLSLNDVGFAFADGHAKLVYDVSPTQQISVTMLGGRSTLDTVDEPLIGSLGNGTDRAGLLTAGWQSTLGPQTVVRQRVSFIGQELVSTLPTGQRAGRSNNRALGYRAEVLHSRFGGVLEAGAEVSRMSGARDIEVVSPAAVPDAFRATWTTHAVYVNFARDVGRGLSLESGVRASDSTLVHRRALAPWILGAWRFRPGWAVKASAGGSRQFPELDAVLGLAGSSDLVPERATHVDIGIEQRLSGVLWQATLFNRVENDVLRRPERQPPLVQEVVFDPPGPDEYRNALDGSARGVEVVVTSDHSGAVSGWMSYTYAIARQTDNGTGEAFWSDFDRRHALNATGLFSIGHRASMGLVLRAGSGVPIPGYFDVRNGTLLAGDHRNSVRLAPYVRLDARVQRTFLFSRHAVTLFGELLNALNHHNEGIAEGVFQPVGGEAVGFARPLLPRRVSIGIEVNLPR